ncbi:MAG TPA: TFIIB-type zinc finger domain-containing protein [Pyrinomonadaceae bacterium]|jgi:ribosomal protein L37AE/L43A|nr:TFIIB-type zinc finger domain-containing protein [Pyrinomonadaceae bacterium]
MTTSPTTSKEIHRYPCPACGADLLYEPHDGFLSCSHCGHQEAIPASAEQVEERSFEQYLQIRPEQLELLAANALDVQCQSCGATVTFTPPEVARQCDFCGVQIVAQAKSADPILAPGGVLPFLLTQPDATAGLSKWLKSRWFAPNALKQFARPDSIHGVYLPFWTYDTNTTSYYEGERGEHYYVTETYYTTDANGKQVEQTRQVQQTRWSPASGTVSRWFDDLLVPATISLPQNRLEALEPWDLDSLKPYDPAFLSGFKAQRYQVELAQGFERVKQVTTSVIEGDVQADIGGDVQRIHNVSTHYSGITFKHLLLPVYAGAYRFNQKLYQIVVNGRTGEIQGERPYSVWKIALFVMTLIVLVLIIALVFGNNG